LSFPVAVTLVVLAFVAGGTAWLLGASNRLTFPGTLGFPLAAAPLTAAIATIATAQSAAATNSFLISFLS
jgi:hypothetical protein